MAATLSSAVDSVLKSIGRTPLLELKKIVPPNAAKVFVKLEYFAPTGSYKDRMALAMIEEAEKRGDLKPGMTVVEYTGGSTGSSLAFICAVKGYKFHVVSSDAFSKEKLNTMRAFGAQLEIVPSKDGKITPDLIPRMIERAKEIASEPGTYFTNQFHNRDALKGYAGIGDELWEQLGGQVDLFCGAFGVSGMIMAVASVLRSHKPDIKIVALEPATSAFVSTGKAGTHRVEGIGSGFMPPLLDPALYNEARGIDEEEGRKMARLMAKEEGIFAGTSSGLNVYAAIQLAKELGPGKTVATVAVDTGLKYLTGDLYAPQS